MTSLASGQTDDRLTILMGVRNGAAHLPDQLSSLADQSHPNWHLICSDDGSTDETPALITAFGAAQSGKATLIPGPQDGFAANFMSLIRSLPPTPGFVGFADQDDIWMPDKTARAIQALASSGAQPTLYCGRSLYWTPETNKRQPSPRINQPCCFRNALIENVASGNTIVLNPAAAEIARKAAQSTGAVFAHDWWLYLLITGVGGKVIFDNGAPSLLYRQHSNNVIGAGQGLAKQIARKVLVLRGAFAHRMQSNIAALEAARDLLTPEASATLDAFAAARQAGLVTRITSLRRIRPYRQSLLGNIGFWGAAGLGRI